MEKPEEILIYDLKSLPTDYYALTPKQVFDIYKKERIVLWDSYEKGVEPKIVFKDETLPEPFVVDLSSTQLSAATQEKIKKVLDETGE
jgi:hypothetical protein